MVFTMTDLDDVDVGSTRILQILLIGASASAGTHRNKGATLDETMSWLP
jgi:hypothetical protein